MSKALDHIHEAEGILNLLTTAEKTRDFAVQVAITYALLAQARIALTPGERDA